MSTVQQLLASYKPRVTQTATISLSSLVTSSGVINPENAQTNNDSGATFHWPTGSATPKTIDFNTNAASVLPADAVITSWKVRYKTAFTFTAGTVTLQFRPGPNHALQTAGSLVITNPFTTYTDPASPPEGYSSGVYTSRGDFLLARISAVSADADQFNMFLDYFDFEVTYS